MQLRSKLLFGLVATVLMVGMMASIAEAQVQITVFPNPASTEVASSRTALTNSRSSTGSGVVITGGLLAQSNLTLTNLILTYSAPITSSADNNPSPGARPSGDALRLAGATGVFATSTITTVNFAAGTVTISMPTFAVNTASGSMRLVGVRVDASGQTGSVTVTASLSNTANNYLLASSTAQTVLTTLTAGIGSAAIGVVTGNVGSGTSTLLTNATIADSTAQILITEGFASAWRTATQESNSGRRLPAPVLRSR